MIRVLLKLVAPISMLMSIYAVDQPPYVTFQHLYCEDSKVQKVLAYEKARTNIHVFT